MKTKQSPAVILLGVVCATLLPGAALLWWKERHSRVEDPRTTQRRAFKAASAAGDVDELRAQSAALQADAAAMVDAAEDPNSASEPPRPPSRTVAYEGATRLVEEARRAEARREYLSDPALWQEPKSREVAQAAKGLERACAAWVDACLDGSKGPGGYSASFKVADYMMARGLMDKLLKDVTGLTPGAAEKLKSLEAGNWDGRESGFLETARFQELMTASKPEAARAAADFRTERFVRERELLSQLLALEVLVTEGALSYTRSRRAQADAEVSGPVTPDTAAVSAAVQSVFVSERADVRRQLEDQAAAAVAEEKEWKAKNWEGYEFKHGAAAADGAK